MGVSKKVEKDEKMIVILPVTLKTPLDADAQTS